MMKRALVFASRNVKELVRDPLSYIFCVGFPLVMLALMTVIDSAIPDGAMDTFQIQNLTPGIAVFALSFVMLFATLQVSSDRAGAFLNRLFSSPMKAFDFILGYTLPLLLIVICQFAVTYIAGAIIGIFGGVTLDFIGVILSCLCMLPIALFFIGIGTFFGTLLSDKSAPPCSSIIISLCGVLGGIYFDLNSLPGDNVLAVISNIFPFSHAVSAARSALVGNYEGIGLHLLISGVWAAGACILAVIVFNAKMKSENK